MDYRTKKRETKCEDCEFYDYDEELDSYSCQMNLDEDEMAQFLSSKTKECPYFRFYNEYKSTQRQN